MVNRDFSIKYKFKGNENIFNKEFLKNPCNLIEWEEENINELCSNLEKEYKYDANDKDVDFDKVFYYFDRIQSWGKHVAKEEKDKKEKKDPVDLAEALINTVSLYVDTYIKEIDKVDDKKEREKLEKQRPELQKLKQELEQQKLELKKLKPELKKLQPEQQELELKKLDEQKTELQKLKENYKKVSDSIGDCARNSEQYFYDIVKEGLSKINVVGEEDERVRGRWQNGGNTTFYFWYRFIRHDKDNPISLSVFYTKDRVKVAIELDNRKANSSHIRELFIKKLKEVHSIARDPKNWGFEDDEIDKLMYIYIPNEKEPGDYHGEEAKSVTREKIIENEKSKGRHQFFVANFEDKDDVESINKGLNYLVKLYEKISYSSIYEREIYKTIYKRKKKQMIFNGAPGTGKTYGIKKYIKDITAEDETKDGNNKRWEIIQFHPSYDYSDFVEGIRPIPSVDKDGKKVMSFVKLDGEFKSFCRSVVNDRLDKIIESGKFDEYLQDIPNGKIDDKRKKVFDRISKKEKNDAEKRAEALKIFNGKKTVEEKAAEAEVAVEAAAKAKVAVEAAAKAKAVAEAATEAKAAVEAAVEAAAVAEVAAEAEAAVEAAAAAVEAAAVAEASAEAAAKAVAKAKAVAEAATKAKVEAEAAIEAAAKAKAAAEAATEAEAAVETAAKAMAKAKAVAEAAAKAKAEAEVAVEVAAKAKAEAEVVAEAAAKAKAEAEVAVEAAAKAKVETETAEEDTKYYYFIIDEINRADVSKVFGELMYAFEYRGINNRMPTQYSQLKTYEKKNDEYSPMAFDCFKDGFFIPENVVIIGTMNDIDKSVESFDFAMRRRFQWIRVEAEEVMMDVLLGMLCKNEDERIQKIKDVAYIRDAIKNMNDKIGSAGKIYGLTSDYHIGPSYFGNCDINAKDIKKELEREFKLVVKPTLCEYIRGRADDKKTNTFIENCYKALTGKNSKNKNDESEQEDG